MSDASTVTMWRCNDWLCGVSDRYRFGHGAYCPFALPDHCVKAIDAHKKYRHGEEYQSEIAVSEAVTRKLIGKDPKMTWLEKVLEEGEEERKRMAALLSGVVASAVYGPNPAPLPAYKKIGSPDRSDAVGLAGLGKLLDS